MRNISPKTYIAIEVVLYISCNCGENPVRSKDICEFQSVTLRYLEHIMQNLVRHKILRSIRGPKGGYVLYSDRRKISLSDIFIAISDLEQTPKKNKSPIFDNIILPISNEVNSAIEAKLEDTTIQDLYEKLQLNGNMENSNILRNISRSEFII